MKTMQFLICFKSLNKLYQVPQLWPLNLEDKYHVLVVLTFNAIIKSLDQQTNSWARFFIYLVRLPR